jgi:hypothetical protein
MLGIHCNLLLHLFHCIFHLRGKIQLVCGQQPRKWHRLWPSLFLLANFSALGIVVLMS